MVSFCDLNAYSIAVISSCNPSLQYLIYTYEKGAKELKSRPKRAFFFLAKGGSIKIKRKVSPFFLPLSVYLPFSIVARLLGLEEA